MKPHERAATKKCRRCGVEKPLTDFYPRYATCKPCQIARNAKGAAKWYASNKERRLTKSKEYYEARRAQYTEYKRQWRSDNKAKEAETRRKAREANLDAYRIAEAELSARRRSKIRRATPAWFDLKAVRRIYEAAQVITRETGMPHHVDHIVPIAGRKVCGLHCQDNLRVIPQSENSRKSNKLVEEIV